MSHQVSQSQLQKRNGSIMRKLFNDEAGFVVSAELILVATIGVLSMVVGLSSVRDAITEELVDISNAFGSVSQTYNYRSLSKPASQGGVGNHGSAAGAGFNDGADDCDCSNVVFVAVTGKNDANATATAE